MPDPSHSTPSRPARGHAVRLSVPRRVVCDLLHFARRVPTVPVQRMIDVSSLVAARHFAQRRISWPALFTKAYAILSARTPELRRAYVHYPWARLYEHPVPVASLAIEREYEGEAGVFFAYLAQPDEMPLAAVDAFLTRQRTEPVEDLFAYMFWIYRWFPRPARRLLWWYMLNVRGARKAEFAGTFGVSVYSSLGAESLHPLSPLTTTLNYGIIDDRGQVPVRIVYDHRVMDGSTVARALARLEEILNGEVLAELRALPQVAGESRREAA